MPLVPIKLAPGVNAEITEAQGMGQIVDCDLIRFRYAGSEVLPEKLGGWEKFYTTSMGSAVRALHAWEGINSDSHLAAGCEESLVVISDDAARDVTPQTETSTLAPAFTTTNGSAVVQIDDASLTVNQFDSIFILVPVAIGGIVLKGAYSITQVIDADSYTITAADDATSTAGPGGVVPVFDTTLDSPIVQVTLTNHGYVVGETFSAPVTTSLGGLTILGAYLVQEVIDANTFTFIAGDSATSAATGSMNGGDVDILYYLSGGPTPPASGYGVGGYGDGTFGLGSTPTPTPGTPITSTNWTLDNWGEILIATPENGPIYTWSPDSGFPQATKIVEAPLINGGAFVSQPAQILVAFASSAGGVQDPLSIHWSDSGDLTNWTVSSQTQAGGYRLPTGSKIVGGCAGPNNFGVIWTDVEVWAMDYIQPPLVFGFNSLGTNCGLISLHGFATLNSIIYWMGFRQFFMLVGETVQTVPCTVWDKVFQDLDTDNQHKITAASNSLFGEVAFYYPSLSGGTGENDHYVKYCPQTQTWDFGELERTAWIDQSPVGEPVGANSDGFIFQHETADDADGAPMDSWFKTGFFTIAEGQNLSFIDWMIPDFKYGKAGGVQGANIQVSLEFCDYPGQAVKTAGPFSVSATTEFVNMRLRGRYISLTIRSTDLGSFWRFGQPSFRSAPDGSR